MRNEGGKDQVFPGYKFSSSEDTLLNYGYLSFSIPVFRGRTCRLTGHKPRHILTIDQADRAIRIGRSVEFFQVVNLLLPVTAPEIAAGKQPLIVVLWQNV